MPKSVELKIDIDKRLERAIDQAPELLAGNMLRGIRRSMFRFRRDFLKSLTTKVNKLSGGRFSFARRFNVVLSSSVDGGRTPAERLRGEFKTSSPVAHGLEFGGRQRARGNHRLVIPIGLARSPSGRVYKKYRDATQVMRRLAARKRLRIKPAKTGDTSTLVVYEVVRKDVGARRGSREGVLPIYLLVNEVDRKSVLNFFRDWERYRPKALETLSDYLDATLKGIERP